MPELKPNKSAFLYFWYLIATLIFLFLLPIALYLLPPITTLILALYLLFLVNRYYQFKKEKYVFHSDRIIRYGGGIFSDYKTEVIIKNITQVSLVKPFIENKLFGTGMVRIETSGASASEEILKSIDKPDYAYASISKLMKSSGFRLSKKGLVQKEYPSLAGVFIDTLSFFLGGMVVFWFLAGQALIQAGYGWVIALYMAPLAAYSLLRFLDLRTRVYRVYDDVIEFSEGFLTKHYSFIPAENLSDSSLSQGIIDRMIGIYDVIISCQGAGKEIEFRHMANGKLLEKNIDRLIASKKTQKAEIKVISELKMDFAKTIALPVIFGVILILAWLVLLSLIGFLPGIGFVLFSVFLFISALIKFFATSYQIRPKSVASRFDFLKVQNTEFSNDMVTAVTFRESVIDKIFGTMSIRFWSIGSSSDITFSNIRKDTAIIREIMKRFSFTGMKGVEIHSGFSIAEWVKSRVYLFSFILLLLTASIIGIWFSKLALIPLSIILLGLAIMMPYAYHYYKRSVMSFHDEYLHLQIGLLVQEDYYAKYNNIKSITTEHYPLSGKGSVTLSIAGEHIVQQGDYARSASNLAAIRLIDNISEMDELIDSLLMGKKASLSPKVLVECRPMAANTLTYVGVLSVIIASASVIAQRVFQFPVLYILPIAFIIPFSIIISILWVKMISYQIDSCRVVSRYGIIYRSQKSIIFQRIAHINEYSGFLNKLFGNGTVAVNTKGSSAAEMFVADIPNYKKFYETLKRNYK